MFFLSIKLFKLLRKVTQMCNFLVHFIQKGRSISNKMPQLSSKIYFWPIDFFCVLRYWDQHIDDGTEWSGRRQSSQPREHSISKAVWGSIWYLRIFFILKLIILISNYLITFIRFDTTSYNFIQFYEIWNNMKQFDAIRYNSIQFDKIR